MTTKRIAEFIPVEQDADFEEYDTQHASEQTSAEKKTSAFAQALKDDENAFINVHRQTQSGNTPMEFVGRYAPDKFDYGQIQAHLQTKFGGGDYRIMLYAKGKLRENKLITIASEIKHDDRDKQSDGVAELLRAVLDRQEKQQALIVNLLQEKNNGGNSRREMMEEMMMMKQMFSSNEQQYLPAPQSQGLGAIKEAMELMEMMGVKPSTGSSSGNEDSGFGDLLEKITPLIQTAIASPSQQRQSNQTQQQKVNPQMNMLQMGLKTLVNAASKKADPSTYATNILDMIPAEKVLEHISDPVKFGALISGAGPKVAEHTLWFNDLKEHLKAQLGVPSKFSGLYDDDESDITEKTTDEQVKSDDLQSTDNS